MSTKTIQVGIVYNAFDPSNVEKHELEFQNVTLDKYLDGLPDTLEWRVGVNGVPVDPTKYSDTNILADDKITIVAVPRGGGAKDILRIVAMVAVVAAAAALTGGIGGAGVLGLTGVAKIAAFTAITMAGAMLVNAILPPTMGKLENGEQDAQNYGYDGAKNTSREGIAIPVVYGNFHMAGNYIDLYSENIGNDQYINGRAILSDGEIDSVGEPFFNEQSYKNYNNIQYGTTRGLYTETQNTFFSKQIAQKQRQVRLNQAGTIYTTTTDVDEIQINILFPRGLLSIDNKGKKKNMGVTLAVDYRKVGQSTWTTASGQQQTVFSGYSPPASNFTVVTEANVATSNFGEASAHTIEYRTATSDWEVYKQIDASSAFNYEAVVTDTYDTALPNNFSYSNSNPTYETEVFLPTGEYQFRATGAGAVVNQTYNVPTSTTHVYTDNRATTIRKTISTGRIDRGTYEIRIRKTTVDSVDEKVIDETWLNEIGEVQHSKVIVDSVATGWYRIKATDQLSGVPNVVWPVKGVKVNSYDKLGNVIAYAWSDNPAWIVLDMLIGERRGALKNSINIDFLSFKEWADYCTSEGLKFNGVFDNTESLWDALQKVFRVGRATPTRTGTKVSVAVDKPSAPVMLFGPGNIYRDTFKVDYMSLQDRANEYEVTYYDANDQNKEKTIRIVDPVADQRNDPPRPVSYSLIGVDNFAQAHKDVWYQLYSNRLLQRVITFDAPVEAIGLTIGDIALIQHDMMNWGVSGRLASGSTNTVIKLDKNVEMVDDEDYALLVIHDKVTRATGEVVSSFSNMLTVNNITNTGINLNNVTKVRQNSTGTEKVILDLNVVGNTAYVSFDGADTFNLGEIEFFDVEVIEERDVVYDTEETDTIELTSALTQAPSQYVKYMFGIKSIVKKPYRLRSIDGSDLYTRSLTFIEYNDFIYSAPELEIPEPEIRLPKTVNHVEGISLIPDTIRFDTNGFIRANLSWTTAKVNNYGGVDIYLSVNDEDFAFHKTVLNVNSATLELRPTDNVKVKLVAFNDNLRRAPFATAPIISQDIKTVALELPAPTGLTVTQDSYIALAVVDASWNAPSNPDNIPYRYRVQVRRPAETAWDEYGVTSETFLKIGDLKAGLHTVRVRTEHVDGFSAWATYNIDIEETEDTVEGGATKGGTIGENIRNPDGSLFVPGEGSGEFDTTPPAIPTGLALTSVLTDNGATLSLNWSAPADSDLAGYDVAIREGSGTYIEFTSSSPVYERNALKRNQAYTARVRAFDKQGNKSGWSSEVTHTTAADNVPPAVVGNIIADTAFETAFIKWGNPTDADLAGARVNLYTSSNNVLVKSVEVAVTPGNSGSVTFTGLTKNTGYYVEIAAFDTSNNFSAIVTSGVFSTTAIDYTDFTAGEAPIREVSTLPNPSGYTGPKTILLTTDGKLYRYAGGAWTKAVDTSDLNGTITNTQINDNAITTPKLVANAVTVDKLATNSVTSDKIVAGSIIASKIATSAITADKLSVGSLSDNLIVNGSAEDGSDGLAGVGIGGHESGGGAYLTTTKTYQSDGASSFYLYKPSNNLSTGITFRKIAVQPGEQLVLSFDWLANEHTAQGIYVRFNQRSLEALSDFISNAHSPQESILDMTSNSGTTELGINTSSFTNKEYIYTVPAGIKWVSLEFINYYNGPRQLFIDNVKLRRLIVSAQIKDGAITTPKIIVNSLNGDRIQTGTLNADRIQANSVMTGSVYVGAVSGDRSLEEIVQRAHDPAYRINNGPATNVTPGKITISGGTTLANWRQGGDETRIAGGSISANTITANKLTLGNRNIRIDGIEFSYNRSNGYLNWSSGNIFYINDSGVPVVEQIAAGQASYSSGIVYIYWHPGHGVLYFGTDNWYAIQQSETSALMLCTWRGGANFIANYGGTIIDGDKITAGSVHANRIVANTITATQIATGAVTAEKIAAGAITAEKLVIASRNITINGITFQWNRDGNAGLTWTPGQIIYQNDAGTMAGVTVNAGGTLWPGGGTYLYIYWVQGSTNLNWTFDANIAKAANNVVLCTWTLGGAQFVTHTAGTIVHGSNITTGSINADRLSVGSLSAISANIGLLRTASSGARTEIENNQIRVYDSNGTLRVRMGVW